MFSWTPEAEAALRRLKSLFLSSSILVNPDPSLMWESGLYFRGEEQEDQKLHLCAFFSHQLSSTEKNCAVGNKELLAVVLVLQEWRHWP